MSTKPQYNTARGEVKLEGMAPFEGVTARVFPLKADIHCLSDFCKRYYNIVPDDIADFRPAVPYIFLAVLHYGKMEFPQLGRWISQNEIAFIIPLEWYRKENDQMVFVDWAFATPFIFVDDEISRAIGREVYGWPKIVSQIDSEVDPWIKHPLNPSHLMTLSTAGFLSASTRKIKKDQQKLLEITLEPPPAASQLQPEPNPLALLLDSPRLFLESAATISSGLGMLSGLPFFRSQMNLERQQQVEMIAKGLRSLGALWTDLFREQFLSAVFPGFSYKELQMALVKHLNHKEDPRSDTPSLTHIMLKQFRDASDPYNACYQALIKSTIEVTNMKNGGLLGDLYFLRGQSTGGFRLNLYYQRLDKNKHGSNEDIGQQILKELGLEPIKDTQIKDKRWMATLEPSYPFWTEVDLKSGQGKTLCWRAHELDWQRRSTLSTSDQQDFQLRQKARRLALVPTVASPRYNITAGMSFLRRRDSSTLPPEGNVVVNVYPLLAYQTQLQSFCQSYLTDLKLPGNTSFTPLGSYVYLIVLNMRDEEQSRAAGRWTPREVAFSIPVVQWDDTVHMQFALVSPFVFSETERDSIVDRELNGRPTQEAKLEVPNVGQGEFGAQTEGRNHTLLELKTEVFPVNTKDEPVKERLLLTIERAIGKPPAAGEIFEEWGKRKASQNQGEDRRKDLLELDMAKIGALEILTNGRPLASVMLKQFFDAEDLSSACYQAVVRSYWTIKEARAIKPIDSRRLIISGAAYPSIAGILGLVPEHVDINDDEGKYYFEPLEPFQMDVKMVMGWKDRTTLYWRAGNKEWNTSLQDGQPDLTPRRRLGRSVLNYLPAQKHLNLTSAVREYCEKAMSQDDPLPLEEILTFLMAVGEPHVVIKSILAAWGGDKVP